MIIKKEEINKYGLNLTTLEIEMKGTTLLIIEGYNAFFMCGALDVDVYNSPKMLERKVICGKAVGVRTIDELLHAPIVKLCDYAKSLGLIEGMKVYEIFKELSKKE